MDRGPWWATYSPWGCKEPETTGATDTNTASVDSTNHSSCSNIGFIVDKNLHIGGPVKFKLVLFRC